MLISETLALRQPSPARAGPPHPGVGPGSLLPRLAPSGRDASVIEQSTIRLPKFVLPGPWGASLSVVAIPAGPRRRGVRRPVRAAGIVGALFFDQE